MSDVLERVLLTPAEAARSLGIGRTKVYELMASGALASVQIGRSRRVPREALAELVDALRGEA